MNVGKTVFASADQTLPRPIRERGQAQLWITVSVNVLVGIVKKELKLNASLHILLRTLSVTLFEKVSLRQVITELDMPQNPPDPANQLN